jgi:hypothetical protein
MQRRLGTPYRRHTQYYTQMRRQAETPGMGNTLTIDEHDVWFDTQFLIGSHQNREFPVGEKTRDIWHGRT